MTVKELIEALKDFDENAKVELVADCGCFAHGNFLAEIEANEADGEVYLISYE